MKRTLLAMIVLAGVLATQPARTDAAEPPALSKPAAALARVLGVEPDEFAARLAELTEQMTAQRLGMKPDNEAVRALIGQLNAAKQLNLGRAENAEEIGKLVMAIDAKRAEIRIKGEQNREANVNTVKLWSTDAERGLRMLQRAARLEPALGLAKRLRLIRVPGDRRR